MLLVEDCQHDADFIDMMLTRSTEIDVRVDHVTSLTEAGNACSRLTYDVVLLDLGLPDSSGAESVSRLKAFAPNTPIIVLTGDDRHATANSVIASGAQDFLAKQHLAGHLLARMTQHSIARNQSLVQAQCEALLDALTGLANRRAYDAKLVRQLSDFERHQQPFCVALFDIDHFKQVNDRFGHESGNQVLQAVADALASSVRKSDQVARYGGEEFAVTFPQTRLPDAQQVALKCHHAVSELVVGDQRIHVTVSVGLAEIVEQDDGRSLFARADEALYAAKTAGRNRCMLHCDGRLIDGSQRLEAADATAETR
jgi:diguanylate cyclase (GGDEF)-like protein